MLRKILYGLLVITTILLGYLVYDYIQFYTQGNQQVIETGYKNAKALQHEVDTQLEAVMYKAKAFANTLSNTHDTLEKENLKTSIKHKSLELDYILGVTVAFEPYAFNDNTKLYAPYFDKNKNKISELQNTYNYTDSSLKTAHWYTGVYTKKAHWVEPYYARVAQTLVADYTVPFLYASGLKKGQLRGVVTYTISLNSFTEMIHELSLGKTGFGMVSSEKGAVLAHPIQEYVGFENVDSIIKRETNKKLKIAYKKMLTETSGYETYFDEELNRKALFFYENIPSSNWKIGVQFLKDNFQKSEEITKKKYINLALVLSILLITLLAVFYNRDFLSQREIWYLSIFTSIILVGNIFWIGYLQHTKANTKIDSHSPPITNYTALNTIVNTQQLRAKTLKQPKYIEVPTGIYINRLEFQDSYNVNASGTVWQKYPLAIKDSIDIGFRFPQIAPFAESSLIEESYRKVENDYLLIGYHFKTTFYLNFDYSDFPFDKRNITLEIVPLKQTDHLLFVPDLKSFTYSNPSKKAGVDTKIKLSGSEILESFFDYSFFSFNSSFGYENALPFEETPVLQFNVNIKEVLITSFITYLIPIFVTLVMIFIFIFATPRKKDGNIDINAIIQGMTAFFFVLIFSHIDLRKNIETSDLVYMEYFYFITYFLIVISTYNLITFSRVDNKLFDYKDNLIVKTTFWPLFLLLVLAVSLYKFY